MGAVVSDSNKQPKSGKANVKMPPDLHATMKKAAVFRNMEIEQYVDEILRPFIEADFAELLAKEQAPKKKK